MQFEPLCLICKHPEVLLNTEFTDIRFFNVLPMCGFESPSKIDASIFFATSLQSRRGLCIVRDDFFFLKSHRLAHAVAPPIPKKSLTFRGPHKFAAQPCGFEPFFFCCLRLAHGLFCRILKSKTGADFSSGGICLQRFRLLHHQ